MKNKINCKLLLRHWRVRAIESFILLSPSLVVLPVIVSGRDASRVTTLIAK
jgi:hypothetical protein